PIRPDIAVLPIIANTQFPAMHATALTEAAQIKIVVIGVPIASLLGLRAAGGFEGLRVFVESSGDVVASQYFSPVGMGVGAMLGIITPVVMYDLIGQDFYQRLFSARSAAVARGSAIGAGLLLLVFAFFPVV